MIENLNSGNQEANPDAKKWENMGVRQEVTDAYDELVKNFPEMAVTDGSESKDDIVDNEPSEAEKQWNSSCKESAYRFLHNNHSTMDPTIILERGTDGLIDMYEKTILECAKNPADIRQDNREQLINLGVQLSCESEKEYRSKMDKASNSPFDSDEQALFLANGLEFIANNIDDAAKEEFENAQKNKKIIAQAKMDQLVKRLSTPKEERLSGNTIE